MATDIRSFGDNKSIVLHTDDNDLYHRLSKSAKCFNVIPYYQEQKDKQALVGVDLYFQKKWLKWLEKQIGVTGVSKSDDF